jgi:PilZ domain
MSPIYSLYGDMIMQNQSHSSPGAQIDKAEAAFIAKRFLTQELAQIEVFGRIGKIFCKMGNLSTSGAFFEVISSNYMPKQKDLVRLTIQLRTIKKTHVIDAEVVWCKGLGIGLQFITSEQFRKKLSDKSLSTQL